MTTPITHHSISRPLAPIRSQKLKFDKNFERLTPLEKLQYIGLIDNRFKLQFTPSKIPEIGKLGKARFDRLMEKEVHFCNEDGEVLLNIKQSEYITGPQKSFAEKGYPLQTYLKGSYAAYVACLSDYLEFLIHEFLASKNLPQDLLAKEIEMFKNQKEVAPHDVDFFDFVKKGGISKKSLCDYYLDFLRSKIENGGHTQIKFIELVVPKDPTKLFPYPANYVLFTVGNPKEKFQTDRIIGKLHHPYLFTRDDICIEIINGQLGIPESAGNFFQMVIDRKFKIVRAEPRHELDFRAGLATLQLVQDEHLLIEDDCTLQSILDYALKIDDERIFTGATDRAKLHCNNSKGFLLSVLAAYSNTAVIPEKYLRILTHAIGEFPPLPSLYKYALLLTLYKGKTDSAEWDPSGFLILYWNKTRIVFPKNFALTSTAQPFFAPQITTWSKNFSCSLEPVQKVLDGELSLMERVLFAYALKKPMTPCIEYTTTLLEYLISTESLQEKVELMNLVGFPEVKDQKGCIKALFRHSFKHGLIFWNVSKSKMDDKTKWIVFEEIIDMILDSRPNQAQAMIDDESPPEKLKFKLVKKIIGKDSLSLQTSIRIIDELIEAKALHNVDPFLIRMLKVLPRKNAYELWKKLESAIPLSSKVLQAIDRLITSDGTILPEDEEWFFHSNPSRERMEALLHNTGLLDKWMEWKITLDPNEALDAFQKHKDTFITQPELYTKFIKRFCLVPLAKEWIESFPTSEQMTQILLFFTTYNPSHLPLLECICQLPGIDEKELLKTLCLQGHHVFAGRSLHDLLDMLNTVKELKVKLEILSTLAKMSFKPKESALLQRWMNGKPSLSLDLAPYLIERKDLQPLAIDHLAHLKTSKNPICVDSRFDTLWQKVLKELGVSHLLIPFYQDREWVKSVYGDEAGAKTTEWGNALVDQPQLKKVELNAIKEILSRTELVHTPLVQLKSFLESIDNEKLPLDMIEPYLKGMIKALLIKIPLQENLRLHHLHVLFTLLKLGITSKLHKNNEFTLLEGLIDYIPCVLSGDTVCDPLLDFIQTLPLVDHGSSMLYHEQNLKRSQVLTAWAKAFEQDNPYGLRVLEEKLAFMPYNLVKASCNYSYQFKLITEQYIDERATKEEFQIEVQNLFQSSNETFKTRKLRSNEDPCLVCINELSHFLKNKEKRKHAYEAFEYLLQKQVQSSFIKDQQIYLKTRKETEDFLLSKLNLLEKDKIVTAQLLTSFMLYLHNFLNSTTSLNFHFQDPILDALELESISVYLKIELLQGYILLLSQNQTILFKEYQTKKLEVHLAFQAPQLNKDELEAYLKKRILTLKATKRSLAQEMFIYEVKMIFDNAVQSLDQPAIKSLIKYYEKTMNTNIPYTFNKK